MRTTSAQRMPDSERMSTRGVPMVGFLGALRSAAVSWSPAPCLTVSEARHQGVRSFSVDRHQGREQVLGYSVSARSSV